MGCPERRAEHSFTRNPPLPSWLFLSLHFLKKILDTKCKVATYGNDCVFLGVTCWSQKWADVRMRCREKDKATRIQFWSLLCWGRNTNVSFPGPLGHITSCPFMFHGGVDRKGHDGYGWPERQTAFTPLFPKAGACSSPGIFWCG